MKIVFNSQLLFNKETLSNYGFYYFLKVLMESRRLEILNYCLCSRDGNGILFLRVSGEKDTVDSGTDLRTKKQASCFKSKKKHLPKKVFYKVEVIYLLRVKLLLLFGFFAWLPPDCAGLCLGVNGLLLESLFSATRLSVW